MILYRCLNNRSNIDVIFDFDVTLDRGLVRLIIKINTTVNISMRSNRPTTRLFNIIPRIRRDTVIHFWNNYSIRTFDEMVKLYSISMEKFPGHKAFSSK